MNDHYIFQDEINDSIASIVDDAGDEELAQVDIDVEIMKEDYEGVSVIVQIYKISSIPILLNFQDEDLCAVDIEIAKELWNMEEDKEGVGCLT